MKKRHVLLLFFITSNTIAFSQNEKIVIKATDSTLFINDSCLYSNNTVHYSYFKDLRKIFRNEKYVKVNQIKTKVTYLFKHKGLGLVYGWRNPKGSPSIYVYFNIDTIWSKVVYKSKYKMIGNYQGNLDILGYEIVANTTFSQMKNNPIYMKYFKEAEDNKSTIVKIKDKKIVLF